MSSDSDEFEVERILASRTTKKGVRQFLVRWKGYDSEEDTWEPEANLSSARGLVTAFSDRNRSDGSQDVVRSSVIETSNTIVKPIGIGSHSETKSVVGVSRQMVVSSSSTNVTYRGNTGNQLLRTSERSIPMYSNRKRNQRLVSSLFLGEFARQTWVIFLLFVAFWVGVAYVVTRETPKVQSPHQI